MPKRPVRYEKQKKARERALKERKALSYEDVPLEQYDQEEIKLKRPPKKVIRLLLILSLFRPSGWAIGFRTPCWGWE